MKREASETTFTPESKEQSKSITYIDLLRHAPRFYNKFNIEHGGKTHSFNDGNELTPEGKKAARDFSDSYPTNVVLVHPKGGVLRHGQTGEEILAGSGKFGLDFEAVASGGFIHKDKPEPVVSGEAIEVPHQAKGFDYDSAGISKEFMKKISKIINKEVQRMFNELPSDQQEEFIRPESKEMRAKCKEQAQNAGFEAALEDEEAVQLAAESQAYQLVEALKWSVGQKTPKGKAKAMPVVGSGMFTEALLKKALIIEDLATSQRTTGFDQVSEIGGAMQPIEGFRIKVLQESGDATPTDDLDQILNQSSFEFGFTNSRRQEIFAGKELSLDWDKIKELAQAAEERISRQEDTLAV